MYKILMIAPTPFFADRGCHTQIYEEIKALQKLGNEIVLCTYHSGRDMEGVNIKRTINIPWYKKLEAGPSYHKFYVDILLLYKSLAVAKKFKPDIIHGHLHEGAFIGYFVSKYTKKPLLFDFQGSLVSELKAHNFISEGTTFYKLMYFFEKKILSKSNLIITQSTQMKDQIINEFKINKEKVLLSMDGVDTDIFRPGYDVENLRNSLNLSKNKKVVVYMGLLAKYQGVDWLLEAIPYILKDINDVHFLIMGYPNVEFYKMVAEKYGILGNITFTGKINYKEAPMYLALGDIAVAPKIAESEADGKLYNYMAMRLPIVCSDRNMSKETLGDLGIYAKKEDPISLANGIKKLLKDENLRQVLGEKLRKKAVDEYSWDSVAKRIMNAYRIISPKSKPQRII
ncbi:glycosyltransferase family 4 protein [bacterium]|nr:glycosyltransferase family 4 protein [bacterium]